MSLRISLSSILFIGSIIFYFSGIFYGLDFTDSFFHINEALHPFNNQYRFSFLLSSIFIKAISDFFGSQLIIFRLVNSILLLIPGVISLVYIRKNLNLSELLTYAAIIVILTSTLNTNILGFDTFTTVCISLIFFICYSYMKEKNIFLLLLLSLLTSISILIRFPNIAVLIVLFFFLFYEGWNSTRFKLDYIIKPFLLLSVTVLTTGFIYYIYYMDFPVVFKEELGTAGHETTKLLLRYLRDAIKLIGFTFYFWICYNALQWSIKKLRNTKLLYVLFFSVQFLTALSISLLFKYHFALYFVSISLSFVVIYMIENKLNFQSKDFKLLILFVLLMFINPFGSNTGLIKAAFFFILFPFIILVLKPQKLKFWTGNLIVACLIGLIIKFISPYEDKNIFTLDSSVDILSLSFINTQNERAEYLRNIDEEISKLKGKGIKPYFYGDKSHIFHYLYPSTSLGIKDFNQNLMTVEIKPQIQKLLDSEERIAIFLTTSYPEMSINTRESLLEEKLLRSGFEKVLKNKVLYYIRD